MGIKLDVLVGHPEHELLFVATQVARAAGLKDPGSSIRTSKRRLPDGSLQLSSLTALSAVSLPKEPNGASIRTTTVLMPESTVDVRIDAPLGSLGRLTALSAVRLPKEPNGASIRTTTVLMPESTVYDMLLKSKAPQTEPFRKWVTEEVLPTIRKTGSYNAEESTNPIAVGLMDELKALRGEVT